MRSHATGKFSSYRGRRREASRVHNANLMRNGADFSVSATTPVKVCADATIVFPLIVSQTNYALWKTPCSTSKFTLSSEGYGLVIHLLTLRCLLHHDYLDLFQTELPPFRKGPYFIIYFLSRGWSTGW